MDRARQKRKITWIILILLATLGCACDEPFLSRNDQGLRALLDKFNQMVFAFLSALGLLKAYSSKISFYLQPYSLNICRPLPACLLPRFFQASYLSFFML